MRSLVLVILAAACGGGGSSPAVDAARPDSPPPPPDTYRYVISQQKLPANNTEARDYGLDLDGDGVVDNQLGMVIATLAGQGFDSQTPATRAIDRGEILQLAELQADSLATSTLPASFTTFRGASPEPPPCADASDTVCRRHLAGTGSFDVAADSARHPPLAGAVVGGVYTGGPGKLHLVLSMMSGTMVLDLLGARVKLTMLADGSIGEGVIAGGITNTERDTKIYPRIQQTAMAIVTRDCTNPNAPDCGCPQGSEGETWIGLLDTTPMDCTITLDEVKNNSLMQSLLAPDVVIDGQQALSVGIGIAATRAAFTP